MGVPDTQQRASILGLHLSGLKVCWGTEGVLPILRICKRSGVKGMFRGASKSVALRLDEWMAKRAEYWLHARKTVPLSGWLASGQSVE